MKNIKKEPIKKTNYETNLTYIMARYYSQGYGRFLSPDPGYDYDQLEPMSWNQSRIYTWELEKKTEKKKKEKGRR